MRTAQNNSDSTEQTGPFSTKFKATASKIGRKKTNKILQRHFPHCEPP